MSQFLALVVATFVSEDLTTLGAGVFVSRGELDPLLATGACALGIYIGDLGLWLVGRIAGERLLVWPRVRRVLPPAAPLRFARWFDRQARAAILGSRLAPGSRLPLYLAAGACGTSFLRFAGWSFVAVVLWTPLLVMIGAAVGDQVSSWLVAGKLITVATLVCVTVVWQLTSRLLSEHGRQRLIARVSRIWRWEFWPTWLFYLPVGFWITWLVLRYGGYRTLASANPGIQDGGIAGESKFDILAHLPHEWTMPSALLEPGTLDERIHALKVLVRAQAWSCPLVLKPDIGQRGTGVRLVHHLDDAAAYLRAMTARVVVQPFHPGPFEAGIFYYRTPGATSGRILCVTDKHFPVVYGDGVSSIEELVWAHRRYRMQARTFLVRLGERRLAVPAAGERVTLGIAGNHAQGAMFTDGRDMITPALEARVDAIAREYEGFFIGRFDVRYRDRRAFMDGRDLAIVELNGATAECTNIYDPAGSLFSAYRQLFGQWRLVFAIGAANRPRCGTANSTRGLFALLRDHFTAPTPFPVSD